MNGRVASSHGRSSVTMPAIASLCCCHRATARGDLKPTSMSEELLARGDNPARCLCLLDCLIPALAAPPALLP